MIFRVVMSGGIGDIYTDASDLLDPQLEIELNAAGSFTFTIPPTNPRYNDIMSVLEPFKTEIDVYEDDELIWFGRVLNKEKGWNNQYRITCEGGLAYFNDSVQDKKEWKIYDNPSKDTTLEQFFTDLITWHNGQVDTDPNPDPDDDGMLKKRWTVGNITIADKSEVVWRETNREFTSDAIQTMCLDTNGGYFITRKEYDVTGTKVKRYIDWVDQMPYSSEQKIAFGINLLDIKDSVNGADICTVLLPLGSDELTIAKVPDTGTPVAPVDGCYHYEDTDVVTFAAGEEKYGRVLRTKTWSDISDKTDLYNKAVQYLKEQNENVPNIECSAAELYYLKDGSAATKFKVGQLVEVVSDPHGINDSYPLIKISMSLNSGAKRITVGTPPKKELTDIVKSGTGSSRTSSGGSSGSGSGSGGKTYVPVKDVRLKKPGNIDFESIVKNKVAKIDVSDLVKDVKLDGQSVVTEGQALLPAYPNAVEGNPLQLVDSGDLRKIKIGNHVFSIPEGGGGSGGDSEFEVEEIAAKAYSWTIDYDPYPNPRTDLPVSLQISSNRNLYFDVYSLRLNYDAFLLLVDFDAPKSASELETYTPKYTPFCIPVSMIDEATAHDYSTSISYDYDGIQYDFGYIAWTFRHGDSRIYLMLNHTSFGESGSDYPNNGRVIGKLYGIKFGGGGGVKDILVDGVSIVDPTTKTADFDSSEFGTTVEANPSETATDDLTTIKIGDTVYDIPGGSSISDEIASTPFINPDNIIVPRTTLTSAITEYTATENCAVFIELNAARYQSAGIWIDDAQVGGTYSEVTDVYEDTLFLKKGQTIKMRSSLSDNYGSYAVYGLEAVSPISVSYPDIYSEEEREIGVWIDGKPLYQKSFYFANMTKKTYYNGVSGVDKAFCVAVSFGTEQTSPAYVSTAALSGSKSIDCEVNNNVMQFWASSDDDLTDIYITMQYTKTTDIAGSGKYLPDGQYAHHYSTSEHIVGTWIDGSTLYERTFDLGSDVTATTEWIDTNISNAGMSKCIGSSFVNSSGILRTSPEVIVNQGSYVRISTGSGSSSGRYLTLQYTKTT